MLQRNKAGKVSKEVDIQLVIGGLEQDANLT